jgi:hypothetical protein
MTLKRARTIFSYLVRSGEAVECPACERPDRLYSRAMTGTMARAMIALWRKSGDGYAKMTDVLHGADIRGGDYAKAKHWGLIEQAALAPGQNMSGQWRLTPAGVDFVLGATQVRSHAVVWRDNVTEFGGELVWIRDVLGVDFDYDELMQSASAGKAEAGQL